MIVVAGEALMDLIVSPAGTLQARPGGGPYNANSAHPYENPSALTNFFQMLAIFLIPAALCVCFGQMVGDLRAVNTAGTQGLALVKLAALAGIDPEWRLRRLVEGMRKRPMPSEGNRVMVVGWERRTETEIYSIADDLDAQNPAIAIASRPPPAKR